MAAADSTVRARIDLATKAEAAAVLAQMGLTVSDAIRLMLVRVASEHALPFAVRVPNAETCAAIEEGEREGAAGRLPRFATVAELMADLNAGD